MFRDLPAVLDRRGLHLLAALRHSKFVYAVADELGHGGHAAVSRRVQTVKHESRRPLNLPDGGRGA